MCHLDRELDAPDHPVREYKHFPSRVPSDPERPVVTHPLADKALVRGYFLAAVNLLVSRLLSASTDQLVTRKQSQYVGSITAKHCLDVNTGFLRCRRSCPAVNFWKSLAGTWT